MTVKTENTGEDVEEQTIKNNVHVQPPDGPRSPQQIHSLLTNLPGFDQCSSSVHVILRVHDKHHLVGVEFKATVQTASVFHAQLAVPLPPAAHRLHLPNLPAAETSQVPERTDKIKHSAGFQFVEPSESTLREITQSHLACSVILA